jgi:hypothetical protein
LTAGLRGSIAQADVEALLGLAGAWEAERLADAGLRDQLAAAEKRVEVLEADRKWWKDNAIRRSKRAAARRSGNIPRDGT